MRKPFLAAAVALVLAGGGVTVAVATSAQAATCTASLGGSCGPYGYAPNPMSNGFNTYVEDQGVGAQSGTAQTVSVTGPGNWSATANAVPYGYTGVQTFPADQQLMGDWCASGGWQPQAGCSAQAGYTPFTGVSSLTVSYAESSPRHSADANVIDEFAADTWPHNYSDDIMFWTDTQGRCDTGAYGDTILAPAVSIGGQTWTLNRYGAAGGELIWVLDANPAVPDSCAQQTSGTIDIYAAYQWMQARGIISSASQGWDEVDAGWEITSADNATFTVTGYQVTGTVAGSPSPAPSPASTSASPSPTSTSPSPGPTSSSPSPAPTSTSPSAATCTTSADNGLCPGPGQDYTYPPDQWSTGGNTYIANNIFNHNLLPSATQTLSATDPGNWQVTADMAAGNTAIISGPQVRQDFLVNNAPAPLSNFPAIYATSTDSLNAGPGTDAEAGYDIWTGQAGDSSSNFTQEMMIWTDEAGRGTCGGATTVAAGVPFGGSNGVPALSWDLCRNGPAGNTSEYIWWLPGAQLPSGTVDVRAMLGYLTGHGYYPSATGLDQIDQTFEIASTGGVSETFTERGLALSSTAPSPSPSPSPTSTSPSPSPTPTSTSPGPSPPPGALLLGDSAVEAVTDSNAAGQAQAVQYTAAASGTSQAFSFYVDPSSTATAGDLGEYSNTGADPGTLLKQVAFTPHSGWNTVTFTGVSETAGTKYWLAELGVNGILAFRDAGSGAYTPGSASTALTALPVTWTTGPAWHSGLMSAYISG